MVYVFQLEESEAIFNQQKSVWFVDGTLSDLNPNLNLSLNSNFYMFKVHPNHVTILEVYKKSNTLPFTSQLWGFWTPVSGLLYNEAFNYIRRRDLSGVTIRIGALPYRPHTELTAISGSNAYLHGGTFGDIWHVIEKNLNITVKVYQTKDGLWSKLNPDGTWDGLTGMLQRDEVDFITNMAYTKERMQYFDFTVPCFYQP